MNVLQRMSLRDEHFANETKIVFDAIPHVTKAIDEYLNTYISFESVQGVIDWVDISNYDGIVTASGIFQYLNGVEISIEGEKILITNSNKDLYQKVIRIGLPEEIVVRGSSKEIVEYLLTMEEAGSTPKANMVSDPMASSERSASIDQEFDLDGLTEEQKLAYKLSTPEGSIN